LFQGLEQRAIAEQTVFDHLGHAGGKLARRQGGQQVRGDEDPAGLVERAGQILAGLEIDAGFPAHRTIDHRQQGGGQLIIIDSAQIRRRRKAG